MRLIHLSVRTGINILLLFVLSAGVALAQTGLNKDNLKKLKDIKGDVKKITITTSEGTTVFEGDQAEWLMKRMKKKAEPRMIKVMIDDDDFEGLGEKLDFDFDFPDKDIIIKRFHDDDSAKGMKKIIVTDENGEKKVTVTETSKDGKVNVQTYTGKEADEYLKTHEAEMDKLKDPANRDIKKKEKKKVIILEK